MKNPFRRWFHKSNPLLDQGGVILLYHRIAAPLRDPLLLSVSPANFADQLTALQAVARIVSLSELIADPKPHTVAITFDDGYADNYHHALPILRAHHAPATFYIATGATDSETEFWWDDLVELLLGNHPLPRSFRLGSSDRQGELILGESAPSAAATGWTVLERHDPHPRYHAFRTLFRYLKELPSRQRDALLGVLHSQANLPRFRRPDYRALTTPELQALAAAPHIEVGAHTVTHPRLASLSQDQQRAELADSRSCLRQILGRHVTSVAYPYGAANDFNAETLRLAAEVGFTHACANIPGAVISAAHRWQLPRFHVRNWSGTELLAALASFPLPHASQ